MNRVFSKIQNIKIYLMVDDVKMHVILQLNLRKIIITTSSSLTMELMYIDALFETVWHPYVTLYVTKYQVR